MAKTILLTGGTGFLGSNLLRRLKADGAKVLLLKRSSSNPWRISSELGDCQFYNADETPLEQIFKDHRIDLVIHCATNYGRSQVAVTDILQANLTLPLHLLQLSAQNGVSAFVNTDTILDKGVSAYSLSKKQFSDWLGVFSDRLLCVNVAIEHFFGPGDDPSKFVSSMVKRMISGDPEIELSPGTQKRDFIYIDDVVAAFEKIIVFCQNNKTGLRHFEVGSGKNVTIREFVETIQKLSENSVTKLKFGALPFRKNEVMESKVDLRALQALGWEPKVSLSEGLARTIQVERDRTK